jgi:hypothetical protein
MKESGDGNESEEDREKEQLERENEILEAELREEGGTIGAAMGLDPRQHNEFLRYVMAYDTNTF